MLLSKHLKVTDAASFCSRQESLNTSLRFTVEISALRLIVLVMIIFSDLCAAAS